MKNITLGSLLKPLRNLFQRFHFTIFIILVVVGLAAAVLVINDMLNSLSTVDEGYKSSIEAGTIDQATLDRIKELHTSDEPVPVHQQPAGRTNPFGE